MSEMIPRWRGSFAPLAPSQAPIWECPSEQATPNDKYAEHLARVLRYERERLFSAQVALQSSEKQFRSERRSRRIYQVLALLGWAAVVVMGVFYG